MARLIRSSQHACTCHVVRPRMISRPNGNTSTATLLRPVTQRPENRYARITVARWLGAAYFSTPALSSRAVAFAAAAAETAQAGDYVKVHYTGTLEDGSEFDSSRGREPLEFLVGGGNVIPGFDQAVTGLEVSGKRKHTVQPADGYGEWRKEMLAKIPTKDLGLPEEPAVGTQLQLGNGLIAVVREKTEESITIDANPPLAGKTLQFDVELLQLTKGSNLQRATFGAGCFWGPELLFARVPGVISTKVGYSQGKVQNPSYEEVCSGLTGHNEVVQVAYDPSQVAYEDLLQTFIEGHDPTQADGQGGDLGSQYRTGIYFHTPEQEATAKEFLGKAKDRFQAPIATEVEEISNFFEAEEYHQQYLVRGGRFGRQQSARKGCTDPIRCYG